MTIKKFERIEDNVVSVPMGYAIGVGSFQAEIEGTETMEELVEEAVSNIRSTDGDESQRVGNTAWAVFDHTSRIPYDNKEVDEERGLAVFVLVNDRYSTHEGIYALRKEDTILKGHLLCSDYKPAKAQNYFRHMIKSLENGILKYVKDGQYLSMWSVGSREVPFSIEREIDLNDEKIWCKNE